MRIVLKPRVSSHNDIVLSKFKRGKIFNFLQKRECLPDKSDKCQYFF
jgi:hypothetical protein